MSAGDPAKDERFQRAVQCFQRRDLAGAEALCAAILASAPDHPDARGLAGAIALTAGRPLDAIGHWLRADAAGAGSYSVLSGLGSAYVQLQRFAEAAPVFARALALRPDFKPAHLNLAGAYKGVGDYAKAAAVLGPLAEADQGDPALLAELAGLAMQMENVAASIQLYRKAVALLPADLAARRGLAYALKRAGRAGEALEQYRAIASFRPDDLAAQTDLGIALAAAGATEDAVATLRPVVAREPANMVVRAALGQLFRDSVPAWHFSMLNDAPRNAAYDTAIRAAVKPGSIVLDIGTGSALLAMMAARAGAAHVYACEIQPLIAEKAREIVAANGFADRITIIAKSSQQLRIGPDLPRKADVLVSEIVDGALIGEGMILTLTHALRELVAENAAIIPRTGILWGMLVESEALHRHDRVDRAAGFDVGAFNEFSRYSFQDVALQHFPHRALSAPVELFRFDLTKPLFRPESRNLSVAVTALGFCHALVSWFELVLDDGQRVSSEPVGPTRGHWQQEAHFWNNPPKVVPGDRLRMIAAHDLLHVHLLLDEA